jgi:hypothetical protein
VRRVFLFLLVGANIVFGDMAPSELMTKIYGKYDTKSKCWHNNEYCMKIDSFKVLNCDTGKRLYLLATGKNANECHVCMGAVGAFVVENQNGIDVVIAQDKKIEMGAFGRVPDEWKLVKLAPTDYWGWVNSSFDIHQGFSNEWYSILAPYGKQIKPIAFIASGADDSGAYGTPRTSLVSKLDIDGSSKNVKIYPLAITVSGINNGKKIKPIKYKINFDFKKWQYKEPANYMIKVY